MSNADIITVTEDMNPPVKTLIDEKSQITSKEVNHSTEKEVKHSIEKEVNHSYEKDLLLCKSHEIVTISDSDDDMDDLIVIDDNVDNKKVEKQSNGELNKTSQSDEIEVLKETNSTDKESCSICLSNFTNRSFLNDCFHAFCYYCILQWSEVSQTCPLCKKEFVTIIHDVDSITEYKETHVNKDEPALIPHNLRNALRPTIRYRTTAISGPNPTEVLDHVPASRRKRKKRNGPKHDDYEIRIKEGRQRVYEKNLFAKDLVNGGKKRLRKATPEFYTDFEGAKHRLFPWIRNELNVLLYNNSTKVDEVLEVLWKLIDQLNIKSDEFKDKVRPHLADKTDQFCHELYMFAISPYDWKTYLSKVQYEGENGVSRWDMSPVQFIGDSIGSTEGDTISRTKWDDETPQGEASWSSSEVVFIEEKELDVNVMTDSSCGSDAMVTSPKLLKITRTSSNEEPIDVDDMADERACPRTPVFIDLDDIPPTPTPPDSPISRQNSPDSDRHVSPIRYNSPVSHMMQVSPLKGMDLPTFPCSPIKNNSPASSRSVSPVKGKGKERKRKKGISAPVAYEALSPVRVLMDDTEPCSSKYVT